MASANGAVRYRVELPPTYQQRIRQLRRLADSQGRGDAFRRAVQFLATRLESRAPNLGRPVQMTQSGLTIFRYSLPPILVEYTVHPIRFVVWFTRFDLLP